MGNAESHALSETQLAILRVLWDAEEASVADVQAALESERALALTTVATMLSRLHRRGVVARRTEGRQFIYRAAVAEDEVRRSMVSDLMQRLFEGDAAALVNHLVSEGEIDADELAAIRRKLARRRGAKGGRHVR
ncbi:MAG: BlaI/MecI/CopY family transcriptional regulator [Planctomycetota bacterium]|nr:BlaI/MecI/CopY family transcriptional regulator [Planctomycetota bacterium]